MKNANSHIYLLYLFMSFLVFNGFVDIPVIYLIGKYGKVLVTVIGIFLLQKSPDQFLFFVKKNRLLLIFWFLCIIFMTNVFIANGFDIVLFQNNVLFIIYVYFAYLLFHSFKVRSKRPDFEFYGHMSKIIYIQFFVWSIIALASGFEIWHTLESRVGLGLFYSSYIQFGIFSCVGGIMNFGVVVSKGFRKSGFNTIMFLLFFLLVFLSNSRNSELVLTTVVVLGSFPFLKKQLLRIRYHIIVALSFGFIVFFSGKMLLNSELSKFTTGRSAIWYYVYEYYNDHSIFLGNSIFGLNNTVLEANRSINYYLRELEFLYFHSSYVEVFCAAGIIGFVLFVMFLINAVKEKKKMFMLSIVIAILGGGLFESYLIQPSIMLSFVFWYLIIGDTRKPGYKKIRFK